MLPRQQPLPVRAGAPGPRASCDHELADDHMGRAIASVTALGIELQLRRPDASRVAAQLEPPPWRLQQGRRVLDDRLPESCHPA